MRAGGLDVAAFTIPTAFFGVAGLKAFHDRWTPRTWFSPWERLKHQLSKMAGFEDRGAITVTADPALLREQKGLYGFHGIEGAHALESDVRRVREVAARGVVFIGPVHLTNNAFGGSSSGSDRGLTALGRSLVTEMNRAGVLLDLAHASGKTFDESLALTEIPPLVSHSGMRAVHDTWRNLGDDQIRAVASRGGVIGVMLAPPALRDASLEEALRHIEHVMAVGGEDAVAIGGHIGLRRLCYATDRRRRSARPHRAHAAPRFFRRAHPQSFGRERTSTVAISPIVEKITAEATPIGSSLCVSSAPPAPLR